jgi:hypothetical protein
MGALVGGMERCYATASPPGAPRFVAGTVEVFRGSYEQDETAAVAENVVAGSGYTFILAPGQYVVVADAAGATASPPTALVFVMMGQITAQNLIYQGCI